MALEVSNKIGLSQILFVTYYRRSVRMKTNSPWLIILVIVVAILINDICLVDNSGDSRCDINQRYLPWLR
jgi:hypothetical protein